MYIILFSASRFWKYLGIAWENLPHVACKYLSLSLKVLSKQRVSIQFGFSRCSFVYHLGFFQLWITETTTKIGLSYKKIEFTFLIYRVYLKKKIESHSRLHPVAWIYTYINIFLACKRSASSRGWLDVWLQDVCKQLPAPRALSFSQFYFVNERELVLPTISEQRP